MKEMLKNPVKWTEATVITSCEAQEAVSHLLITQGAGGLVFDETSPDSVAIRAYYSDSHDRELLKEAILKGLRVISEFLDTGKKKLVLRSVNDEDWAENWKKYYKPFLITDNIAVKPVWEDYTDSDGKIVIEIDPGMAFGNGTHESTRLCAKLIEKHLKKGDYFFDLGCGTAILSIIAHRLGAGSVTAADTDPDAVRCASVNIELNGLTEAVKLLHGSLAQAAPFAENRRFDLVAANIIADTIIDISKNINNITKKDAIFIASGIIADREEEVAAKCSENGLSLEGSSREGEWTAMVFRCKGVS
ncbi:MAG: 50S ribosomal protein L11 methyltransferase [Eubacteriales bacterium]|jgi:ribosomal protein L11 methyltransferase|nr:50S ribosomal protein L11 methyltransferase [Eubacteriales bacterium]